MALQPQHQALAVIISTFATGLAAALAGVLGTKTLEMQQRWKEPVFYGLVSFLVIHTAALGRDLWKMLPPAASADEDRLEGWESAVYLSLLLVIMLASHSYWTTQIFLVMDNRWVVLGQGLTILMYVGCGIALGVLSWDHEAATMSSDLGQVVVSGIFLCASTLVLLTNAVMIAKNLPTSASRLRPTTLRLSIIGLEMSLVPLLLSIATTVTFFVFPESHLYLALRSMWPGIYLVNVLLCLLCKSNKRHIILISHNMRNADSFGNLPNDFFEKGRWTFNPPTFGAKSTTPAAPVPAMPPSAYDIKSYVPVNEPDPDDASVYSTNTTQHPIASYYLQKSPLHSAVPERSPRSHGGTLKVPVPVPPMNTRSLPVT